MRIALVQLRLEAKSRAANIQGLGAAIDRAAQVRPAPDLVVLPGACDTGGGTFGRGHTPATLTGVGETIAWKAREWGVFIAAGLHCRRGESIVASAVLFDPDGDVVACGVGPVASEGGSPAAPLELWSCALGDLGVLEPSGRPLFGGAPNFGGRGALVAVPVHGATAALRRRTAAAAEAVRHDAAFRGEAWWAVTSAAGAGPATSAEGATTFLCDPGGHLAAWADTSEETIIHAEVPLTPAPVTARAHSTTRDDQAD